MIASTRALTLPRRLVLPAVTTSIALPAFAEEIPLATTKMGGQLEKFVDLNKGYRLMKPTTWNSFEGEQGAYDMRWIDIVEATTSVTISTSPYTAGASIDDLADIDKLGDKLTKSRGDLLKKRTRTSDGLLYYDYEFQNNNIHELLAMCVNKNRLWQISAKAPSKTWNKREDLFRNVVGSFVPKL